MFSGRNIAGCLFAIALPMFAMAQKAEMPSPNDFVVGDAWEWRQIDNRTKLEEGKFSRTVVQEEGILKFRSESGVSQISNIFIGSPVQTKPWRVWPLEIGKEWEYDEDWKRADGVTGNTRQSVKVVGFEEVTVPAGTFMAFKIEHKGYYRNSNGRSGSQIDTYWYAPDIKADVKRTRDDGYNKWARELVSHKRGQQK